MAYSNSVSLNLQPEKVAVLGLGYVGCVSAACLARLGHHVAGVDRDDYKVRCVNDGKAPFYEPGLEQCVAETRAAGLLRATTNLPEALREATIALVCVGTPSDANGNLDLEQLRRVAAEMAGSLEGRTEPLIVAIRSTVWPGTCEELLAGCFANAPVEIVSHPEFLREGTAMKDFLEPPLTVVGGSNQAAVERVANLYRSLAATPCLVTLRTAEAIKYTCNAFHALKIAFANEVGALCDRLDIPADQVMDTLCRDEKLNISRAYLKPGFAFGGSCLPKDLRALNYRAGRLDLELPLLESVLDSNNRHLDRAIRAVLALPAQRLGVFGLTFKEETDDVRESPVVTLLEQLLGKGRQLRVFDPQIRLEQIYGSNQRFLLAAIPHIGKLLEQDLDAVIRDSEYLLITQKPSAAHAETIRQSGIAVIDLTGWRRRATRPGGGS